MTTTRGKRSLELRGFAKSKSQLDFKGLRGECLWDGGQDICSSLHCSGSECFRGRGSGPATAFQAELLECLHREDAAQGAGRSTRKALAEAVFPRLVN